MFTGIITDIGTVRSPEPRGDLRLTIGCGYDMGSVDIGASIALNDARSFLERPKPPAAVSRS